MHKYWVRIGLAHWYITAKRCKMYCRTEQNRTEQNRTEQNRTEQNRTEDWEGSRLSGCFNSAWTTHAYQIVTTRRVYCVLVYVRVWPLHDGCTVFVCMYGCTVCTVYGCTVYGWTVYGCTVYVINMYAFVWMYVYVFVCVSVCVCVCVCVRVYVCVYTCVPNWPEVISATTGLGSPK